MIKQKMETMRVTPEERGLIEQMKDNNDSFPNR